MSESETLFNSNTTSSEPTSVQEPPVGQEENNAPKAPVQDDLFATKLSAIKAPDGRQKYADVATALDAIQHQESYIQELSEKAKQLEEELTKRKGMEEMLQHMDTSKEVEAPASEAAPVDGDVIAQLVESSLQQREQKQVMEANRQKVVSALTEKYGEKAEEVFAHQAESLGMDVASLSDLSLRHPSLVLKHFDTVVTTSNPVTGTVNTSGVKPASPEKKPVVRGATTKDVVDQFRAHAT